MRGAGRGSKREGGFCYGAAAAAAELRAPGLAGGRWLAETRGGGKQHLRLHWQAKRQENQEKGERQESGTWGPRSVGPSLNSPLVAGPYGLQGGGFFIFFIF